MAKKYRVVARTVYHETSEPIEAESPDEALKKAREYFDIDDSIVAEYVETQDMHEVREVSDEQPPATWLVGDGDKLDRWH